MLKQFINDCININMGRPMPTIYTWLDVPFAVRFLLSLSRMRISYRYHMANSPWHRNSTLSGPNSDSYWEWWDEAHQIDIDLACDEASDWYMYGGYDDN